MYPSPRETGGQLIRRVVAEFRDLGLPKDSYIHCAVSGGADSVALAHLLIRYGRRIAPVERISLLHVNHGWRGEASDADEAFVRGLAADWGVPIRVERVAGKPPKKGPSWEAFARSLRRSVFDDVLGADPGAWVVTAHHMDDLAETALWRLCTGAGLDQGGAILRRHGREVRPLLTTRRAEIEAFLREEGVAWREDASNQDQRFMRARLRQGVMPLLEQVFPRSIENIAHAALAAQVDTGDSAPTLTGLLRMTRSRPSRAQIRALEALLGGGGESTVELPGGWRFERVNQVSREQWILSRIKP